MLSKIKTVIIAIPGKIAGLSGIPAVAVGAAIGYVGHPIIKIAIDAVRLALKI